MIKLRNNLIGVDQGSKVLFSDFENSGPMWSGSGSRISVSSVKFKQEFKTLPMVHISLDMWDMDSKTNQRADISTKSVSQIGFDIVFKTWGDTKIARVRAAWFAIGEFAGDDEWELY